MNTTTRIALLPALAGALAAVLGIAMPAGDAPAAERPAQLRKEIAKTEDAYFALYNKLNADRQFDMVCKREQRTGTNFATRVCEPRYLMAAKEQAASERMTSAVSAGQSAGSASERGPTFGNSVSGGASNVPLAELATKDAAFRQNMLEVLQKSPELQALGKQRDDLSARLNASGR